MNIGASDSFIFSILSLISLPLKTVLSILVLLAASLSIVMFSALSLLPTILVSS